MDRRSFLGASGAALLTPMCLGDASNKRSKWKGGKKWVYSITYDEGPRELLNHAVPLHRKYGIPGHVALVSSQIGVPRNVPGSSYHGMMILNKEEIQGLAKEGWGFSCHSLTHCGVTDENAQQEVVEAKKVLENAIDLPITIFTVPGTNDGHPPAMKVAAQAGYKAILTIYDRVNVPGCDLILGRIPLHTRYLRRFLRVRSVQTHPSSHRSRRMDCRLLSLSDAGQTHSPRERLHHAGTRTAVSKGQGNRRERCVARGTERSSKLDRGAIVQALAGAVP